MIQLRRLADHPVVLVFLCTLTGATAQLLFKTATNRIPNLTVDLLVRKPWLLVTNPYLFFGYALYGLNVGLLTLALRKGELSLLYPIISLTYVWVAGLSVLFFGETINWIEGLGLATVVTGVAVLGADGRK